MRELAHVDVPRDEMAAILALPHPQLRIVLYYLFIESNGDVVVQDNGAVMANGKKIAETVGINRSLYARTVPGLVEDGWIEPIERIGNITYYGKGRRLSGMQVSGTNVLQFQQRSA
jgi:hypothetical protein